MSGRDDHEDDMALYLRRDGDVDSALEALLAGRPAPAGLEDLTDVLVDLRALGGSAAPAPTGALAELLASPAPLTAPAADLEAARRRRAVRAGAAALAVAVMTVGSVGVAAAQGTLPDRAQDAVASAVSALTPFSVPRAHRDPATPEPAGASPSPTPTPSTAVGEQRISRPAPPTLPAAGGAPAAGSSSVQSGVGDSRSPRSGPDRRSDAGGSRDATAPPAAPRPAATPSEGGDTSSSDGSGADAQPSSSPTDVPGDSPGADLTGGIPTGDGVDAPDAAASPDS